MGDGRWTRQGSVGTYRTSVRIERTLPVELRAFRPMAAATFALVALGLAPSAEALPPRIDENTRSLTGVLVRDAYEDQFYPRFAIVVHPGSRREARFPLIIKSGQEDMSAVALANQIAKLSTPARPRPERYPDAAVVELRGQGKLTDFGPREIAVWAFDAHEVRVVKPGSGGGSAAALAAQFDRLLRARIVAADQPFVRRAYTDLEETGILKDFYQAAAKLALEAR